MKKKNGSGVDETASRPAQKKRVARLYKVYEKAQDKLDQFRGQHEEVFEHFSQLANERNVALDQAKRAMRETGIGMGPIEVIEQATRVFDGKYLYTKFKEQKELRSELVNVEFKVNAKGFDRLVQAGDIDPKIASRAVIDIKRIKKALHVPSEIVID